MTEEEFNELMNRIPIMEEKLNRLLLAFEKISENENFLGIIKNESFPPLEYDKVKEETDNILYSSAKMKEEEAKKLQEEANAIREELGL